MFSIITPKKTGANNRTAECIRLLSFGSRGFLGRRVLKNRQTPRQEISADYTDYADSASERAVVFGETNRVSDGESIRRLLTILMLRMKST